MPKHSVHCAISRERTGKSYCELHRWIDNNKDERSVDHRNKNHYYTRELRDFVFKNFGGAQAISEWLFHIALDNLDTYMITLWNYEKERINFVKFGFREDGSYIYCDEDELSEEEMEEEFE